MVPEERLCWEATEVKKRLSDHSAHKSDIQVTHMFVSSIPFSHDDLVLSSNPS